MFFAETVIIILGTQKIICIAVVRSWQDFFKPHYPRSKTEKGISASRIVISFLAHWVEGQRNLRNQRTIGRVAKDLHNQQ